MKIINEIEEILKSKEKVVVAIDGQSGSGKSTYASKLASSLDALLIHMDDYFLHPNMKTEERLSESGGNVHYERIHDELFSKLNEKNIELRKFNCMTNVLEDPVSVENKRVIIVEGVYSMHKSLIEFYDYKILLKVPREVQLYRIKERSGEFMLNRFIKEWIPLEDHYFASENIEELADIILEN